MQLLAVAYGGTLHQHLPDVVGHDGHRSAPRPATRRATAPASRAGSRIAALLGPSADVNSLHHQGVADRAGGGTGWAEGGRPGGRADRGGRGPGHAVRARRAVAPRGDARPAPVRRAGRCCLDGSPLLEVAAAESGWDRPNQSRSGSWLDVGGYEADECFWVLLVQWRLEYHRCRAGVGELGDGVDDGARVAGHTEQIRLAVILRLPGQLLGAARVDRDGR